VHFLKLLVEAIDGLGETALAAYLRTYGRRDTDIFRWGSARADVARGSSTISCMISIGGL
jgi:hypothetical protein